MGEPLEAEEMPADDDLDTLDGVTFVEFGSLLERLAASRRPQPSPGPPAGPAPDPDPPAPPWPAPDPDPPTPPGAAVGAPADASLDALLGTPPGRDLGRPLDRDLAGDLTARGADRPLVRLAARLAAAAAERPRSVRPGPPLLAAPGTPVVPVQLASTVPLRMALGICSLAALALTLAGAAAGLEPVRVAGALVFCVVGVGSAPWQSNGGLDGWTRLALTTVVGLATATLVPFEMLVLDEWHPTLAFGVVALVCTALHAGGLVSVLADARVITALHAGGQPPVPADPGGTRTWWPGFHLPLARSRPAPWRAPPGLRWSVLLAAGGGLLSLAAALAHRHLEPGFYGFLPRIGPVWYVGLALILTGLVAGLHRERAAAFSTFLLVGVLTLTPALVYDGPRSQSAAKHADFATQIQTFHQLDTSVAIYNAWSGFFAAAAWLCHVAGIDDPMRLAVFWPPLLGVLRVVVLRYLAGQVLPRTDQRWVAVALAVLADSIGADYFSPQSVGFVLGLAAAGLALSRTRQEPRLVLIGLCGLVLAVSHQFSPYAAGGALLVLVLFRQVKPWWTPGLVLVPAAGWALAHEAALRGVINLRLFGRADNFKPPPILTAPGLQRLPVVRETVLALVFGIAVLGLLAALTLLRHRRDARYWALACCPASGLAIVAANPYGQEGIFRAALFGLPWLALLAAPALTTTWRPARPMVLATASGLLVAFLVSSFGLDAVNVVRPADLAAVRYFEAHGGPRPPTTQYLLVLGPGDLPTTPGIRGGGHQIWDRDQLDDPSPAKRAETTAGAEERLLTARLLQKTADPSSPPTLFALWSPVTQQYGRAYAIERTADAAALRDAFRAARYWSVTYQQDGTYLFRFEPSRYPGKVS